jgi:hypothetical protein
MIRNFNVKRPVTGFPVGCGQWWASLTEALRAVQHAVVAPRRPHQQHASGPRLSRRASPLYLDHGRPVHRGQVVIMRESRNRLGREK